MVGAVVLLFASANVSAANWLADGISLANSGETQAAIGRLEVAVRLDPKLADAWFNLGALLHRAGQVERAIEALERAVALRPKDPQPYNALG